MPVKPQNTSRCPRSRRTGRALAPGDARVKRAAVTELIGSGCRQRLRTIAPGGAQLEEELRRVGYVRGISCEREIQLLPDVERTGEPCNQISGMQRDHNH